VPDQTGRGDVVDVSVDTKIGPAINVEIIQGDKDGGFPPELDRVESDFAALFWLRSVPGMNVHRVNRFAKNVLVILWIGNPASPRCVEDRV